MAQCIGLDGDLPWRFDTQVGVLRKAHQRREFMHLGLKPSRVHRVAAVLCHAAAVDRACRTVWDLPDDRLDVRANLMRRDRRDQLFFGHGGSWWKDWNECDDRSMAATVAWGHWALGGKAASILGPVFSSKVRILALNSWGLANMGW